MTSEILLPHLRCPACKGVLEAAPGSLVCRSAACGSSFPVLDGVPVLVDEKTSSLSTEWIRQGHRDLADPRRPGLLRRAVRALIPTRGHNVNARANYRKLGALLAERSAAPLVLVIGGQIVGEGFGEMLERCPGIQLVETDIAFGPRTRIICDAHSLPFADGLFDAVIIQGVLQYLLDPALCVAEIHRSLRPDGLVYSETGFMQQVNVGAFDFTRFTHTGHRRLFRWFRELDSGAVCGAGMALAWAYEYFLLSFVETKPLRLLATVFARYTSFFLKYFDNYLLRKRGSLDAASSVYFLGARSDTPFPDRELPSVYRGLIG